MGVVLEGETLKKLDFLDKALSNSRYYVNKVTYLSWIQHFKKGGKTSKYQVEVLLINWLTYFVFLSCPKMG